MTKEGPYIGVAGITTREQMDYAIYAFPTPSNRLFSPGLLASFKSLRDMPVAKKWETRTPNFSTIAEIFTDNPNVLNLVHYSCPTDLEEWLLTDLLKLHNISGPNLHGFQLNMVWPSLNSLDDYLDFKNAQGVSSRVVLQIRQPAIDIVGGTPRGVANKLYNYVGLIDDILFDMSGGNGELLDSEYSRSFLSAIASRCPTLGIGVAGGLGPNSLHLVQPLIEPFPNLSTDAESELRDSDNQMLLLEVKNYLIRSGQLFS